MNAKRKSFATRSLGFSLIEVVGVLSVIALLAAAAAPKLIKRVDAGAKTSERENLKSIADALLLGMSDTRQVPASANVPTLAAAYLSYNPDQISTNGRGFPRIIVSDPAVNINGPGLPFAQTTSGSTNSPVSARFLLLSTIAIPLPTLSLTASDFTAIWNAPEDTIPSPLSSWGGRGEDLLIERIELAPLFHKVVLVNVDPNPNIGRYAVDSFSNTWVNTLQSVSPVSRTEAYYMEGTVVTFYRHTGELDTREIIHEDMSFVYQNNKWGRRLGGSDDVVGGFGQLVAEFLKPPPPALPKFAATQQAVINELYSFLYGFSVWAYGDPSTVTNYAGTVITPAVPPFSGAGGPGAPNYPYYSIAAEAQVHMATFTDNLIH